MKLIRGSVNLEKLYMTEIPKFMRGVYIIGSFSCADNELISLENSPYVSDSFFCFNNNLETLKGMPSSIPGSFYCSNNCLNSLEGFPTKVGGDLFCFGNLRPFTVAEIKKVCVVGGTIRGGH